MFDTQLSFVRKSGRGLPSLQGFRENLALDEFVVYSFDEAPGKSEEPVLLRGFFFC